MYDGGYGVRAFSACGKDTNDTPTSGAAQETAPETNTDATKDEAESTSEQTGELTMEQQMTLNSLLSCGNNYRMKKAIEGARGRGYNHRIHRRLDNRGL